MIKKSLICPIEGKEWDVERAINEVENFTTYFKEDEAKARRLRLISEEVLGMIGGVLDVKNGRFWIENEDGDVKVRLAAEAILGTVAKDELDQVSPNVEYKGFSGLIRKAVDNLGEMFRDSGASIVDESMVGISGGTLAMSKEEIDWSLAKYQDSIDRDMKAGTWDELEMSVLKKLAKDIKISYRNDRVDIVVYTEL